MKMKRDERWAWEGGKQIFSCLTEISSVWIETGYELNSKGSIPIRSKSFLFSTASRPALGPILLPIQLIPGFSFPWGEADDSTPFSGEIKHDRAVPPLPPNVFMTSNPLALSTPTPCVALLYLILTPGACQTDREQAAAANCKRCRSTGFLVFLHRPIF
jgi:hypothetical protein